MYDVFYKSVLKYHLFTKFTPNIQFSFSGSGSSRLSEESKQMSRERRTIRRDGVRVYRQNRMPKNKISAL